MSRANHWEPAQGPCTSWDPKHSEACPTCAGCLDETYDAIAHVRSHNSDRDKVIGSVVLRAVFIVAVVIVSTSAPVLSLATASTANTAAAATGQRLSWPVRSAATASVTPGALLPCCCGYAQGKEREPCFLPFFPLRVSAAAAVPAVHEGVRVCGTPSVQRLHVGTRVASRITSWIVRPPAVEPKKSSRRTPRLSHTMCPRYLKYCMRCWGMARSPARSS